MLALIGDSLCPLDELAMVPLLRLVLVVSPLVLPRPKVKRGTFGQKVKKGSFQKRKGEKGHFLTTN